jgi:hypothetical protein
MPSWRLLRPQFIHNIIPSHSYLSFLSRCYICHPTLTCTNSPLYQTLCHPGISFAHSLQRTSSHLVASFHSCYSAMHTILLAWGTNSCPLQTPCHHGISSTHSFTQNVIPSCSYHPSLSRCYTWHPTLPGINSHPLQTSCHPSVSSAHNSSITSSHLVAAILPCRGATHATLPSQVQINVHSKHRAILASPPPTIHA